MTERLLVYGLLRQGLSMNEMMRGAVHLGERRVAGFDLYDFNVYPGAVPGAGTLVAELYQVGAAPLDEAEGLHYDPPLYLREAVRLEDGEAWLYVYAGSLHGAPKIASGDWLDR